MIRNPALKHFLKFGLKKIDDLPEKKISELRLALALNWGNESGFIKAMSKSGIDKERLSLIFRNESHESDQYGGLETAKELKMGTKVWIASGGDNCCKDCQAMNGEEVPIASEFSDGSIVAHKHPECLCRTEYKKDETVTEGKIFSRQDIQSMSLDEYAASRDKIMEQVASGQIK